MSDAPARAKPRDRFLLRFAIAFVWLFTGMAVLHPHYRKLGMESLAPLGLPAWVMWATCAGEVLLGLRILFGPSRAWLTWGQMIVIVGFTIILSFSEPQLLHHPFGVLSKNVPLLLFILALREVEAHDWTHAAYWLVLRGLAFLWIWEGLVPCVIYAEPELQAMIRRMPVDFVDPKIALRVLGIAEIIIGLTLLVLRGANLGAVLVFQFFGLLGVIATCSWHDPLLWLHPFSNCSQITTTSTLA